MGSVDDPSTVKPGTLLLLSCVNLILAGSIVYVAFETVHSPFESTSDAYKEIEFPHRRLQETKVVDTVPSYMEPMMNDLEDRRKLFKEAPQEEVKYWFEYTGPLQKYFYRFSKSRGKADFFEGRDDSGVLSARYISEVGGTKEYRDLFLEQDGREDGQDASMRLYENCLAMGHPIRPDTSSKTIWHKWFGESAVRPGQDRCRILFALNTVGAGRGSTMLWETNPPTQFIEPPRWISEQETAATHLERNLKEINSMCKTGLIAARVQVLVCENIPPKWIEWMDSLLVACGGSPFDIVASKNGKLEDRPSPVQVVVASSAQTVDTCHDLKSGFMEQRMQDLIFAHSGNSKTSYSMKTTDPALVSSDAHDLYVAMTWSTLVSIRAVASFLQASADLAAAATSPFNKKRQQGNNDASESPFLVPSFVQVSYVSEENSKIAKWRMHGDFFHPASWEICKESFEMTWMPGSLSGSGSVHGTCPFEDDSCGQWWVYFVELQMPTSPAVYANEVVPPPVQGGSNSFWMLTESHRQEYVRGLLCRQGNNGACPPLAQAVIPLGDLQSFLINFTPNTALGKRHMEGRRPGYSKADQLERDRERVKERKQLEDVEDIESALFDYTIYPSALFHKDATLKAVRNRDAVMTGKLDLTKPQKIKSSYFDITITKPRPPVLGWCQAMARKGLCSLYADYFRRVNRECREACGMARDFTLKDVVEHVEIGTAIQSKK